MQVSPKKVVIIGFDAPIVKSIKRCVKEGKMPNIAKLIQTGVWADNCLVPHPTITPPNWTTIVTGAWPGTHGITCFHIHKPGTGLDSNNTYEAFNSQDCQAEYIWEAWERADKKSIVINYPTTWPPRMKKGVQLGGFGLHINDWRHDKSGKYLGIWDYLHLLSDDQCITTEELPFADVVSLEDTGHTWKNLPPAKRSLSAKFKYGARKTRIKVTPVTYYVLVQDTDGNGYNKVSLSKSQDGNDIFLTLKQGEWSNKVSDIFETEEGKKKAFFMCKLIELSSDASKLNLYVSQPVHYGGWSFPDDIAQKLEPLNGLPLRAMEDSVNLGWIDTQTYLERAELENTWFAEAAQYLMTNNEWTLFALHAHIPDHTYHFLFHHNDPVKSKTDLETCQKVEDIFYDSLDKMVGKIFTAAGEDTLKIIVSDHGAVPTEDRMSPEFKNFSIQPLLTKAGLTAYKTNELTGKKEVDWTKTKAISQRSVYVYVNLKSRDPDGIVEPGEEYEKVREQIINLLYDYTDKHNGKKPIAFAWKKEDARILGLYGDRIGDIVYGVHAWVSGEHGRQLTTGDYGMGSMKGLFIINGPGIKKGAVLDRNVWLVDVVPTICYSMNLPIPKTVDGAVIYQVFEDIDFKSKETETLRKNYERVKTALEGQQSLTHSYDE